MWKKNSCDGAFYDLFNFARIRNVKPARRSKLDYVRIRLSALYNNMEVFEIPSVHTNGIGFIGKIKTNHEGNKIDQGIQFTCYNSNEMDVFQYNDKKLLLLTFYILQYAYCMAIALNRHGLIPDSMILLKHLQFVKKKIIPACKMEPDSIKYLIEAEQKVEEKVEEEVFQGFGHDYDMDIFGSLAEQSLDLWLTITQGET